jgi:hypothetical protein
MIIMKISIQRFKTVGHKLSIVLMVAVLFASSLNIFDTSPKASALSGSTFNPGFIISDSVFYNSLSMSAGQIQDWLNDQVPTCDSSGTQATTNPNGSGGFYSRAQWYNVYYGLPVNNPVNFTCLKNYQASVGTISGTYNAGVTNDTHEYCQGMTAGTYTAAQMIYDVAQSCYINPQVLLVLLQKEQGLVTDDWPWPYEYTAATGYDCPDSGTGCSATYSGFFNQIYWAAWQYQYYKANPTLFNYQAGRTQYVAYSPTSSCGGANVLIQNQATAGLYNYTPYQPDAAALGNLYGTGDSCSSYGNRNFWRLFNDWFGDPTAGCQDSTANTEVLRLYDPKTYQHYYTNDYCEADTLTQDYGYSLEGPVFNSVSGDTPGAVPVYRMYNTATGIHFYTISQTDINGAAAAGYHLEGIGFYVASPSTPGAFPVYRMYNAKTFIHLWVTNQTDIAAASKAGYSLEGVTFYATP